MGFTPSGNRIEVINSCIFDRAEVFWPCTKNLPAGRQGYGQAEQRIRMARPAQNPTRWWQLNATL